MLIQISFIWCDVIINKTNIRILLAFTVKTILRSSSRSSDSTSNIWLFSVIDVISVIENVTRKQQLKTGWIHR